MSDILVSICCCAYNQENYIARALDSFLMQKTRFGIEVLVHDDASTDRTADIIREYASEYPEIIKPVCQTENKYSRGIKVNKVYNFSRAKGKYIALCEGDDYWNDPFKLQKQADAMEADADCSLCVHSASIVDANGKERGAARPFTGQKIYSPDEVIRGGGGLFATNSMFFPAAYIDQLPEFYNACPVGDYPLAIFLSFKGKVLYLDEPMSTYRYMALNSWSSKIRKDLASSLKTISGIERMLARANKYSSYKYAVPIWGVLLKNETQKCRIALRMKHPKISDCLAKIRDGIRDAR